MEKVEFQPSEEFKGMLKVGATLRYVGEFLLQNKCDGYEARQHCEAIEMIKGQFDEVDKQFAAHPEYPAWKEAAQFKAQKDAAAREKEQGVEQPQFGE